MNKVVYVKSDTYHGLYTREAYMQIRMVMSVGEFHRHIAAECFINNLEGVSTLLDLEEEQFELDFWEDGFILGH